MLFMVERVDFHRPRLKLNMLHIQIMLQCGASPVLDSVVVMCLTNVILSCLLSLPCNLVVRYERPKFPTSMIYFGLRVASYSLTILFTIFPFPLSDSFIIQLKQRLTIIPQISTKRTTTSHNKDNTYGVGNPCPGLGHAHNCVCPPYIFSNN